MDSRKKKRDITIAVLLSALMLTLTACAEWFESDTSMSEKHPVQQNWGVTIPLTARELYSFDTPSSIFGDGLRWNVYAYDDPDANFFSDFESERSAEAESEIVEFSEDGDIPREYFPDFTQDYIWKRYIAEPLMTVDGRTYYDDNMYILYFPSEKRLYVIQMFI
ncbi:MAG: hypothetical protein LBL82_07240 [Oscillospiraceae bacterium]|jgi:hypothetical protein|nr:hypothetical protein [Oscillospiraceae bacterium]